MYFWIPFIVLGPTVAVVTYVCFMPVAASPVVAMPVDPWLVPPANDSQAKSELAEGLLEDALRASTKSIVYPVVSRRFASHYDVH